jgi:homocysteine S-methyltransferase
MSHAELDEAPTLDRGDPARLAEDHLRLRGLLPQLSVVGGCCGTDHEHITAIASALATTR